MRSSVPTGPPGQRTGGIENWLLRAAEAGDADSQYNLGILCDNGLDDNEHPVAGNRQQAVKWLLAAAEQGLPLAQVKLAEVYADAPDILGSHTAAGGWFLLAALELDGAHLHRARSGYERIASHLNPAQIEQARRLRKAGSRSGQNQSRNSHQNIPTEAARNGWLTILARSCSPVTWSTCMALRPPPLCGQMPEGQRSPGNRGRRNPGLECLA